ncbi:MAG: hypothetical protein JSV91_12955 [Phycisphaerales bacterium]|nr:MAG: hypothetical protein JSV91_12955 [Phycisphaerales bacterium]
MRPSSDVTSNRTARVLIAVAIVFAVMSAISAVGQVLDLAPAAQPPELDENTYANKLVAALHEELQALVEEERAAEEVKRPVYRAMINFRIIAAELLAAGEEAGPDGSGAYIIGVRLCHACDELDGALRQLLSMIDVYASDPSTVEEAEEDRVNRAWKAVRRFDQLAIDRAEDVRTANVKALDESLTAIFAPLAEAISVITDEEIVSHWPSRTAARATSASTGGGPMPPTRPRQSPQQLLNRLEQTVLDDEALGGFSAIISMLNRAEAYPDLRPQVDAMCHLLARGLDLADALSRAHWLDDEQNQRYGHLLSNAVTLLADPENRPNGQETLERLDLSRLIVERVSALPGDRDAQAVFGAALLVFDAGLDNEQRSEDATVPQRMSRLRQVLDRMIAYREAREPDLPRDLRVVHRDLQEAYESSERALLAGIETLARDPRALSDPAFVTLLADQEEFLEALLCTRRMPIWEQKIGLIDPNSAEPFSARMRRIAGQVVDPNRRPESVRILTEFDRQMSQVYPLPFEAGLKAASPEAVEATGGLHRRLLSEIEKQRRVWAEEWAGADPDRAAIDRMMLLYRLMSTMADTVEAQRLGNEGGRVLNRWGGWELGPSTLARTMNDVPTRLKLATGAVLEGDDLGLKRQLDRLDLDSPLARLIGRLNLIIGPAMRDLPDGAPGIVGQITRSPTADAWMIHRREEFASLCRYALEQDHARNDGDAELAGRIGEYVNHLAEQLLTDLQDR